MADSVAFLVASPSQAAALLLALNAAAQQPAAALMPQAVQQQGVAHPATQGPGQGAGAAQGPASSSSGRCNAAGFNSSISGGGGVSKPTAAGRRQRYPDLLQLQKQHTPVWRAALIATGRHRTSEQYQKSLRERLDKLQKGRLSLAASKAAQQGQQAGGDASLPASSSPAVEHGCSGSGADSDGTSGSI